MLGLARRYLNPAQPALVFSSVSFVNFPSPKMSGETKFSVLCSLFNWIQRSKSSAKKRSKFRKFLDNFCKPTDYFGAIRLILPSLDRERGSYGLKESVLATCLIDALGMSRESDDALRLINWRKGGAKTGVNAGNFSLVATEVLQLRQGMTSGGLTIKELNDLLDRLASSENRVEKTSVLSDLIRKTNAQEMKWIIMIILKDLKLGISEKSIFHEFHPDAEDLFNVTCDLKLVCEKLRNRSQRHKRQNHSLMDYLWSLIKNHGTESTDIASVDGANQLLDIEVGKPVRPQLALRVGNAAAAWKRLHGKEVVVECKFDGDRIQIHKNGVEIHFFSRNFIDHPEYGHAMSSIIIQNILVDRCILDGEMLVWDASLNRFAEFGSNQEIAKAAKEGLDSDRQLCYVAFDILYFGDTSVIHQSLKERHELLQKVVKPLKGCLEILVPNGGLNAHRPSGEPCWSLMAYNVDDIERFFKETIENRDEGIVLKDLGSKWEPGDRSAKWLKLKPEYIRAGSDLDVLIIGGYYGSGRRGGEVAQFLVGLAELSAPNTFPRRFISFCRVGTGLSDEELDAVVTKLKPYFRKNEYPKKAPPSFYQVTNNSKERPDVWIDSPEKSIILSITSDIRTIRSEVFAAPYSLRFPRIDRVRDDKPWHECLDVQSFVELVHSSNGTTQRGADYGVVQDNKPTRMKASKTGEKKNISVVPSHFIQTDISDIKGATLILSNMMFYFVNVPPTHSLDSLHKMVAENGGTFSMNMNSSVTHCVAAESKGIKFRAAKLQGDVIHCSWLFDCCSQKKLLPLQPKYFLFLSDSSKKKLQEEIDEFSDSYYCDLDIADINLLLSNINRSEDYKTIDYYMKKYCPKEKWSCFHGCCIYFHPSIQSQYSDSEVLLELALRRMKLEVSMGGGKISSNLCHATHMVIMSLPGFDVDFDDILNSFSPAEIHVLRNKRLHVVGSQWLEDCFEKEQKLLEDTYSLKLNGLEESNIGDRKHDLILEDFTRLDNVENQSMSSSQHKDGKQRKSKAALDDPRILTLPKRDGKRKRGRPASMSSNKGKMAVIQPRRTRPRRGNKSAKIYENDSDTIASSDEDTEKNEAKIGGANHESTGMVRQESPEIQENERVEDSELSQRGGEVEREFADDNKQQEWSDRSHAIETGSGYNAQGSGRYEKLEVMADPVQAMLLDMIPSLGTKKVESIDPVVEDENPTMDLNAEPSKKKKVSYKDVAGELLRDW